MLIKFPQTLQSHYSIPPHVELYWIRHLHSCANMLESIGGRDIKLVRALKTTHVENITERTRLTPNPHVTPFGISHALGSTLHSNNLTDLIKPDLICVSQLIRTWETAYLLFLQYFQKNKETPLYVVPYIGEQRFPKIIGLKRINLDNQPDSIPLSKKKFMRFFQYLQHYVSTYEKKRFQEKKISTILNLPKIQYINRKGNFTTQSNKSTLSSNPNFHKFMNDILPHLISLIPSKDKIRIVLVTHSHFMEHHILPPKITIPKYLAPRVDSKGILRVWNADCYRMTSSDHKNMKPSVHFAFPERISFDSYTIPSEIGGCKYHVSDKNTLTTFFKDLKNRNQNKHHEDIQYAIGMCGIEEPKYLPYVLSQWKE